MLITFVASAFYFYTWWRHQMETFSASLAICAGNSPVTGEFPSQRPETQSFEVYFDLCLNKRLSKQLWGWWFDTPSRPLWRHCIDLKMDREATQPYLTHLILHDDTMAWKRFPDYSKWPFVKGVGAIPLQKVNFVELWWFPCCSPEQYITGDFKRIKTHITSPQW